MCSLHEGLEHFNSYGKWLRTRDGRRERDIAPKAQNLDHATVRASHPRIVGSLLPE